jgi:hypothetical protein
LERQNKDRAPDKPIAAGLILVPSEIELDGDSLAWTTLKPKMRPPGQGTLSRFIELHEATAEEILAYARDWGVIGFCAHGLPASHNHYPFGVSNGVPPCEPLSSWGRLRDPLNLWREYSRRAKGLWQVGIKLDQGRQILASDWEIAGDGLAERAKLLGARATIAEQLSDWMVFGQVRPVFAWNRERKDWEISIGAQTFPNLFGLLAIRLMLAVSDKDGFAICTICNGWYMPNRRPAMNRESYCTKVECQKAKWRLYKRRDKER